MTKKRTKLWALCLISFAAPIACQPETPLDDQKSSRHQFEEDEEKSENGQLKGDGKELGQVLSTQELARRNVKLEKKIELRTEEDLLDDIGFGSKQTESVCEEQSQRSNRVIQAFCVQKIRPKSLIELQRALGLEIVDSSITRREDNGTRGNPAFAIVGHSTSLVGRSVHALNPRAILFTPPSQVTSANRTFTALSFVRGEQLVEIVAFDGRTNALEFYLLRFTQACNHTDRGCTPGELLTPAIETDWKDTALYSSHQLRNTVLDCLHCHQPQGPQSARSLRMQELATPWSHWFSNDTDGLALINDYYAMHGENETYAGIPGKLIALSSPALLEEVIIKSGLTAAQVNEYNSLAIELQINALNPKQPADNTIPGVSDVWRFQYNQSKTSALPPIPYHDLKVTEHNLASKAVGQYRSFRQGNLSARDLDDFRDIFKLDHTERAKMGFAIELDAPATEILVRACGQCHNSRLDQNLGKAKFNVDFNVIKDRKKVLGEAIRRVQLGYSEERLQKLGIEIVHKGAGQEDETSDEEDGDEEESKVEKKPVPFIKSQHIDTMPPSRFRHLTDEQIDKLVALFLEKSK